MNQTHKNNANITKESHIEEEEKEETLYSYTLQLINSCSLPMVMKVIIELGVLRMIHDHHGDSNGLSAMEIASRMQINNNPDAPAMLDRMLRLLATYSVVNCTAVHTGHGHGHDSGGGGVVERRYSSSQVTKFFVPDDEGVSLAHLLNLFVDEVFLQSWSKLKEAVLEGGIPFNMAHDGMHAFEYPAKDQRYNEVFNNAMYQSTTFVIKKIVEKYKGFECIKKLVDVGGGLGHTLGVITSKYPHIKGINFDLAHVIHNALPCLGVEHVSGDMFQSVPQGDAIFLKWILHDWNDEHCLKLLKNCYKALGENGKVIVVEAMMPNEAETTSSARALSQIDIHMMTQTPGGKERTKDEFEALAKAAGFNSINFVCCVYNFWVMELHK